MSTGWLIASLLVLPAAAAITTAVARSTSLPPGFAVALNGMLPGSGLVLLERPVIEVALCVLMGEAAMLVAGGTSAVASLVPFMVVGAVWAGAYTTHNPLHPDHRGVTPAPSPAPLTDESSPTRTGSERPSPSGTASTGADDDGAVAAEIGYSVAVACTECGADVDVPVLQHMARCAFCGSDHLVVGHDETLWLTVPARAHDPDTLREALLDHYRYQEYLRLYRRSVAPLERQATEAGPSGGLVSRPEINAAAAVAEATVSRKADAYRQRLAGRLRVRDASRFLSPYRHGVGTLYQTAFGREPTSRDKRLRFTVGTIEAAVDATTAMDLPKMGKLSYLRALRTAASCPPEARTLPLDLDESALDHGFGDLDRKQLDRTLDVIRVGSRFRREVAAVVWRPWWVVEVEGPSIDERLLVDGASGSVAGAAPFVNPEILVELPPEARAPGTGLQFVPMECPTCGDEFPFDHDAVIHFCTNCHRAFEIVGRRKVERAYLWDGDLADDGLSSLVPFWQFPLRLRTADGTVVTDLWQLKDGIDGVFDQIGDDAPRQAGVVLVPAIRCINSRLTATAFNRLFRWSTQHPPTVEQRRFPIDVSPRPWSVNLDHDDARHIAPLYLANAFGRRDLAKVNVHQVASWMFDAELASDGRLCFAAVPSPVTEPFRRYVGRARTPALTPVVS